MANKYNPGDTAFIVESNRFVREVEIIKITGEFATLRFSDTKGGVKLRESRLFPTKEEAENSIKKNRQRLS